jgi:hypothetical protein
MISTISFAPSPSIMVELAVPKAASVSDASPGVGPPRHTAILAAPAGVEVQQVGRVCDVVQRECIN